ncbi:ARM repeat-containing protein [Rhizopogon vinicolor AM-OR11-026]|uniref:ARM repeat-containing protein n=1 Tax=Rhizopogon vinicolor AM-OR11-026 TaxID=1314800 RepID=A0A1B7MPA3_9AGAM|nr:ARM repeat-containing protein [Rhizopogon vinicolor AM-OR11-026]
MTESLWAFIQRCWEFVPEDRPTSFNALDFAEIEFRATLSCDPAVQPSQGVLSQTPGSSRLENHLISIPSSPALSRVASPVATLDSRHIKSPRVVFNVNTINDRLRYIAPLETSANHWIPKSAIEAQLDVDSPAMIDRKVKALLSRLTMETFDSVSDQIIQWANKSVNENDGHTLVQVIQLVFEKATETAGSEIYALLCRKMMERISPEVQDHRIKNAEGKSIVGGLFFMKHLLNRCQVVFERGWSTEVTTDEKGPEEAELYSDEYYPKKAKRQGLGLIKFMGELFKLQMLTERVMHECVKKLLGNLDEEEIETLCQLLKTVGQLLDTPEAREHMDVYFTCMKELGESPDVSIHMQFMLQDVVALRERKWVGRNVVASPTTIATIHKGVRWIDTAKNRATAENESYNPQPMSPGGSRRGGERNQAHGPNGRAVAEGSISRPPPDPKSDDLSQFGKISKGAPKVIMFAGGTNDSESLSTSLNSNIFRMFSQSPELTPEHSTQHSHSTSRKTSIDLGQAGVPEPPLQHKKLQLFPQPKTIVEENMLASSDDALERAPTSMSEADAKKKIDEDVNEFFTVRNLEEADVYFINLPREHRFRLVDKLVEFALESKEEEDARLVGELFARVTSNGQCTPEVFEDGFIPMAEFLDDIAIVAPKTFEYMAIMLRGAGLEKEPERLQRLASKLEDSNKLISLVA